MQVIVKHPRIVGGKLYAKGPQPQFIPDEHKDHWFLKALIKCGDIVEVAQAAKSDEKDKVKAQVAAELEKAELKLEVEPSAEDEEAMLMAQMEAEEKAKAKAKSAPQSQKKGK